MSTEIAGYTADSNMCQSCLDFCKVLARWTPKGCLKTLFRKDHSVQYSINKKKPLFAFTVLRMEIRLFQVPPVRPTLLHHAASAVHRQLLCLLGTYKSMSKRKLNYFRSPPLQSPAPTGSKSILDANSTPINSARLKI